MLPHNSFCSHNRTVGSQILHIKVSRMTTLTQKNLKVERSFYCIHILLKCWPCTLHLNLAGTNVKWSKVFWFHTWAFSLGPGYNFLHLHHTCKSTTNMILFQVQVTMARRACTQREVTAHHICQLRSDRPQNTQPNAERCQNTFRGWCPSDTFQMTEGNCSYSTFPFTWETRQVSTPTTQGKVSVASFPSLAWAERSKAVASPHLSPNTHFESTADCIQEFGNTSKPLAKVVAQFFHLWKFTTSFFLTNQIKSHFSGQKLILLFTDWNNTLRGREVNIEGFWPFMRSMTLHLILLSFICLLREEIQYIDTQVVTCCLNISLL